MPDEMLSFFAGGSTPRFVKPVAYDIIEVPVIENNKVRKIAHDAPTTFLTSECMVQRSSMGSWMLSWLGWSWMGGCGDYVQKEESAIHRLCT